MPLGTSSLYDITCRPAPGSPQLPTETNFSSMVPYDMHTLDAVDELAMKTTTCMRKETER